MGFFKESTPPTCLPNQHCSDWARIYLEYCLCNPKDGVALFLGIVSIICWGVAEIPQIITSYREKSTEGLSVAFLMTWVIGDLFNLVGCLLEPATLPTQYYVALLYTATTVVLTGQTIYYGHIYHRFIANESTAPDQSSNDFKEDASTKRSLLGEAERSTLGCGQVNGTSAPRQGAAPSTPIPVAGQVLPVDSFGRDLYYKSARSLSRSPLPTFGSWVAHSHDSGRSTPISAVRESLLSAQSAPTMDTKNMLSVVPAAAFFICMCVHHICINNTQTATLSHGAVIRVGRKLLQDKIQDNGSSAVGTLLGWAMATIYMGGRLPQICLNMKRGNAQGLNPLMFVFALIGNATYVGSILVRSMEWSTIRPNLPWLVDAGGCVLLDAFILAQFLYFSLREPKKSGSKESLEETNRMV